MKNQRSTRLWIWRGFREVTEFPLTQGITEDFKKARNVDISFLVVEILKHACTRYKIDANVANPGDGKSFKGYIFFINLILIKLNVRKYYWLYRTYQKLYMWSYRKRAIWKIIRRFTWVTPWMYSLQLFA